MFPLVHPNAAVPLHSRELQLSRGVAFWDHFEEARSRKCCEVERCACESLETREKLRKPKSIKLSEHVKSYAEWAEKTNRSALRKDRRVLTQFMATIGDRSLDEITAFHVERWKTLRARDVAQSSVNRELNVIRGCLSRAVEWGRLIVSPMKSVKPYGVDNVRMRGLSPDEITLLLDSCPRSRRSR